MGPREECKGTGGAACESGLGGGPAGGRQGLERVWLARPPLGAIRWCGRVGKSLPAYATLSFPHVLALAGALGAGAARAEWLLGQQGSGFPRTFVTAAKETEGMVCGFWQRLGLPPLPVPGHNNWSTGGPGRLSLERGPRRRPWQTSSRAPEEQGRLSWVDTRRGPR